MADQPAHPHPPPTHDKLARLKEARPSGDGDPAAAAAVASVVSPSAADADSIDAAATKDRTTIPVPAATTATATTRAQTFVSVMAEPCMAAMLRFTSVADRVRSITVSKAWLTAVKRPALWANCEWKFDGSADIPCEWLRPCIGYLIYMDTRCGSSSDVIFSDGYLTPFSRLRHLSIYPLRDPASGVDLLKQRAAFQQLRLASLNLTGALPVLFDAIFGRSNEVVDPDDVSTHPALWSWCDTLERLVINTCESSDFIEPIRCLAQRTWPQLATLRVFDDEAVMPDDGGLGAWRALLTAARLPSCTNLSISISPANAEEFNCGDLVKEFSSSPFPQQLRVCEVQIAEQTAPLVWPLSTEAMFNELTPNNIALLASASSLRELILVGFEPMAANTTTCQLFELIGAHSMPHLKKLSPCYSPCDVDSGAPVVPLASEAEAAVELTRDAA